MIKEELMKKLELARIGSGTQTYNDVVLILSKEETLELLKYIEQLEKEKQINERLIRDNAEFLDKYLKLQDKYQKLKKRYKKRAELSNELCKALNKYEKAFELLVDLDKKQEEILKAVFENVGDIDE